MSFSPAQFPFVPQTTDKGTASLAPVLPLTLSAANDVTVSGLLDTGAAVNVLPFAVGARLGFDWDQQTTAVQLAGTLLSVEARVVVVSAFVAAFSPVRLVFAWAKVDKVRILLGQVNFFQEFDVCFFRSRQLFEIGLKQGS